MIIITGVKTKFLNQFIKNKIYKILKKFNLKTKYASSIFSP